VTTVKGAALRPGDTVHDGGLTRTVKTVMPRPGLGHPRWPVVALTWEDDEPCAAPSLTSDRHDWEVL